MNWDKFEKQVEAGPYSAMKTIGCVIVVGFGGILSVIVLLNVLGFIGNPAKQASRVVNKTIDADNVIANYEWFKQRHEDIAAIDTKITDAAESVETFKADAGDRDTWHREDREEYSRLSAVHLGLKQQRADLAAEYNARSRMTNRSIFKTGDVELPGRIED
jgi:hypothetical protein